MYCPTDKIRYRTRHDAEVKLSLIQKLKDRKHAECRVYKCPECNGFHLTSKELRAI